MIPRGNDQHFATLQTESAICESARQNRPVSSKMSTMMTMMPSPPLGK